MDIRFVNTLKKFESSADEVVSELFGLLGELLPVQERAVLRIQRLEQKSVPYSEKSGKLAEILDKCKEEYSEVISGRVTEKEMQWKHPSSIGLTAEYAYIKGEYTVDFTMKKSDTATVVTHYRERSLGKKHKFVLKLVDGKWLVDEVYSGNEDERKWYYTEI